MKTKLLLSLIAVMFVSILYLLYLNFSPKKVEVTLAPKTGNIVLPTSTPRLSSKTYSDSKVSFEYPGSLSLLKEINSLSIVTLIGSDYKETDTGMGTQRSGTFMSLNQLSKCNPEFYNRSETIKAKVLTTVNNFVIYDLPESGEARQEKVAMIKLPTGDCIDFYCDTTNGCQADQFKQFSQILSTFKFFDSDTPEIVVKKYLDASVAGDLATAKIYCPSIESTLLTAYDFVKYEITGSKSDKSPNFYHVYVKFIDKSGKVWDTAPNTQGKPLEVYLSKNSDGIWQASTWYFYQ